MRSYSFLLGLVLGVQLSAQSAAPQFSESWQRPYEGTDATGKHVLGLWQFNSGAETNDAAGKGAPLTLTGGVIHPEGRFGACLESFSSTVKDNRRFGARTAAKPNLSPAGAFTVEMWIKAKKDFSPDTQPFLLDKKYVAHSDYQWQLSRADKSGHRRLVVNLGFGEDSESFASETARFEPEVWYHVAFVYDGAGEVRFFRDGASLGVVRKPERQAIAAGIHPLSIGERIGSYYNGFPGFIDQVRICNGALEFRPASVTLISERRAFLRMEAAPPLEFEVQNRQKRPLQAAQVRLSADGMEERVVALPELQAGASHRLQLPLDTQLRPGEYTLRAMLEIAGEKPFRTEETFSFTLAPRPLPQRMPVVMWGVYNPDGVLRELPRLKEIGFTHCLGVGADFGSIWSAGRPTNAAAPERVEATRRLLDEALANDFGIIASLSPARWLREKEEFRRVDRTGKAYAREDVCCLFPGFDTYCFNAGASVAQTYGAYPAFEAALVHTEVRDSSQLCFHEHDRAAFRQFAGFDIPAEATIKNGITYPELKDFPADRVIPDNHPILQYYRWFWTVGDGWNALHTAVDRGLKSTGRKDFWTFFDPAVRVPSIHGSGGAVDVLSHWTYSYPDPLRIGTATDELFAMAAGAGHPQAVMKMTQVIWYRSQTAPQKKRVVETDAAASAWEDADPEAQYITIAPMHLREAFWTKLARPIRGLMYHGWQSLVPTESTSSYRHTHPQTQHELKRLVKEVVEPLGPTLLQVPDRPSEIALLQSFAAQMFARRGTYGWGRGWNADAHLILQHAQLPPQIVFDETIAKGGLDGFRVLVLADCDVLTETVARRIREFQSKGGIIVGDENVAPAIKPDIVLTSFKRAGKADADRATLIERAGQLRKQLDARYRRHLDSTNPDVISRARQFGTTDYVFAVNDRREFGDYVGQYGMVMENGLPAETELRVNRPGGHVYDLVAGREVTAARLEKQLRIPVQLGPCEGRVFMITDQPIDHMAIKAPASAKLGSALACQLTIANSQGAPINAVIPVHVEIVDPAGRHAEFSGYYGAKGGRLELALNLALNDSPGVWEIRATELASRQVARHYLRVTR